jgi:hypothetical protein
MPVYLLKQEMPHEEFKKWQLYFESRPVGWRDDNRVIPLLNAWGSKVEGHKIFESLAKIKLNSSSENSDLKDNGFNVNSFKNSGLFSKLLGAKGGDKLEFLK